jgi:hypothetical protein
MRTFHAGLGSYAMMAAVLALAGLAPPVLAQTCPTGAACLGSGNPSDAALLNQRVTEKGSAGTSGIFDIAVPDAGTVLTPVQRVPRAKYGVVGPLPLTLSDLDALLYPGSSSAEKNAVLEGLTFFTTVHTPGEPPLIDNQGIGPMNNQPFCQGCHENTAEAVRSRELLGPTCPDGSICASLPHARHVRPRPISNLPRSTWLPAGVSRPIISTLSKIPGRPRPSRPSGISPCRSPISLQVPLAFSILSTGAVTALWASRPGPSYRSLLGEWFSMSAPRSRNACPNRCRRWASTPTSTDPARTAFTDRSASGRRRLIWAEG